LEQELELELEESEEVRSVLVLVLKKQLLPKPFVLVKIAHQKMMLIDHLG
jgi:hypothetical protein